MGEWGGDPRTFVCERKVCHHSFRRRVVEYLPDLPAPGYRICSKCQGLALMLKKE